MWSATCFRTAEGPHGRTHPSPNAETAIFGITESDTGAPAYESFFDDDSGSNETIETQIYFCNTISPGLNGRAFLLRPKRGFLKWKRWSVLVFLAANRISIGRKGVGG